MEKPSNAVWRSLLVAVDAEALISGQGYGFACPCRSLDVGGGHFDVRRGVARWVLGERQGISCENGPGCHIVFN
jgi:hypothetical protein